MHAFDSWGGGLDNLDPLYQTPLRDGWNAWLRSPTGGDYDSPAEVAAKWGAANLRALGNWGNLSTVSLTMWKGLPSDGKAMRLKRDWAAYLSSLEDEYFERMRSFVRGLGTKALLVGTQTNYLWLPHWTMRRMDVFDVHICKPAVSIPFQACSCSSFPVPAVLCRSCMLTEMGLPLPAQIRTATRAQRPARSSTTATICRRSARTPRGRARCLAGRWTLPTRPSRS